MKEKERVFSVLNSANSNSMCNGIGRSLFYKRHDATSDTNSRWRSYYIFYPLINNVGDSELGRGLLMSPSPLTLSHGRKPVKEPSVPICLI